MKRIISIVICCLALASVFQLIGSAEYSIDVDVPSAILMEAETGTVLFEKEADMRLPPASVTKIMTLLLVMEALDNGAIGYEDIVTVSEKAASMGGSQIFLEVGEQMTVDDMLKSVTIASANDAAVALAEFIAGTEEGFVKMMNSKAEELGMLNTNFENTNGLDDTTTEHYTSARDIAIMSRELIKHKKILEYSSTWMDSVRNGEFGLTNTNKLVKYYEGCNGLKTGSTSKAKFCISATAKRNGMQLICVIMAADTKDIRNNEARKLLDWGFANYACVSFEPGSSGNIKVKAGVTDEVGTEYKGISLLLPKDRSGSVSSETILPDTVNAPVKKGEVLGKIVYRSGEEEIAQIDIKASESVKRIGYFDLLLRLFKKFLMI